jgi:hypothetical protein
MCRMGGYFDRRLDASRRRWAPGPCFRKCVRVRTVFLILGGIAKMRTTALALTIAIAGCVGNGVAAEDADYVRYRQAKAACDARFGPRDARKEKVAYVRCVNNAEHFISWRFPDIQNSKEAARVAIAEKIERGLVTDHEGTAEIAAAESEAEAEATRRDALIRATAPPRVRIERPPIHCRTWADGFGITTQVYTDCE